MTVIRQDGLILERIETTQRFVPFTPSATSYGLKWSALLAVRYLRTWARGEFSMFPASRHQLVLTIQAAECLDGQFAGRTVKRPPAAGSIYLIPAGSSVQWWRQGVMDALIVHLEPSLVVRVAAEAFELDSSRTVLPPLNDLDVPEVRSTMLAVNAELRGGGVGGSLLAESFANPLAVHLIRYIRGPRKLQARVDGRLPSRKLRKVIEYMMENLGGSPTLQQMAGIVNLSPYHFARRFKAATGSAPHQYIISRRVERAQHLLRTKGELSLAEVAFRAGFANQSHFCSQFKRIAGVTPRRFRENVKGRTILESKG